ncbi:tetratricopeptide repeat protein [Adhaeribacter rhizoryzae]|uniref:Tetratricopeptide repeat protein n=1 Tax=Adhaeribacter rhizoryzae TaxID=2607907 RepID=A0A5M6D3Y0_9BACT|nr:tetratricopeptide repeat protein [Adhaeribacter rhizoryzae]KAA5541576.1 tetratricopeptide repeat protein [Adhaeribacter rhizoryzae]
MIDDANKNELIEQYVQGKLSGNVLAEFKNKLAADAAFRNDVALEQAIVRNLKAAGRNAMRLQFENYHQEISQESYRYAPTQAEPSWADKIKEFINDKLAWLNAKPYWAMAAATIILIITSTLIFFNTQTSSAEIYTAYYTPYPIETFRSAPNENALATEAAVAYNAGDYQHSISLYKQLLATAADEQALFYLGNAYLSAGLTQQAISTYETYLQQYQEFAPEAKWYLGLSYIKAGQDSKAKAIFKELAANPENEYSDKAQEILKKYKFKEAAE